MIPGRSRAQDVSPRPALLFLERWLRSHPHRAALFLVVLGLAARMHAVRGSFLSPDEVLQIQIASAPGLLGTYKASLSVAHPPLFLFLLHLWKGFVVVEWAWRLLPMAFGTVFLWTSYRWAVSLLGGAAALSTLALIAFLPSLVLVSVELRPYTLLLCLTAAALAVLEHALREKKLRQLALFTLLSVLCLLTHYSALFFLGSAWVYATVRLARERPPRRFVRAWIGFQALLAVLLLFLYQSHISRLRGSGLERYVQTEWLRASYFQSGRESPFLFCVRQTFELFRHLFSAAIPGIIGLAILGVGITLLVRERRPAALLLGFPFLLNLTAGLLALYPYGGTRHSIELALFACAGIGAALAILFRERFSVAIGVAVLLAPAAFVLGG